MKLGQRSCQYKVGRLQKIDAHRNMVSNRRLTESSNQPIPANLKNNIVTNILEKVTLHSNTKEKRNLKECINFVQKPFTSHVSKKNAD